MPVRSETSAAVSSFGVRIRCSSFRSSTLDFSDPLFRALAGFVTDERELTFSVDFNSVGSEDSFRVALLEASLASVSLFGKSSSDMSSLSRVWFQASDPAPDRALSRLGGDVPVFYGEPFWPGTKCPGAVGLPGEHFYLPVIQASLQIGLDLQGVCLPRNMIQDLTQTSRSPIDGGLAGVLPVRSYLSPKTSYQAHLRQRSLEHHRPP